VTIPGITLFAGFVGLSIPRFEAPFTPCIEIGWRLAAEHWNRGYATAGARAALAFAFDALQVEEVVSFTVPANLRSRRVMEKIGMVHSPGDDFDHPLLPEGTPFDGTSCTDAGESNLSGSVRFAKPSRPFSPMTMDELRRQTT
jgi:hypothetical protein